MRYFITQISTDNEGVTNSQTTEKNTKEKAIEFFHQLMASMYNKYINSSITYCLCQVLDENGYLVNQLSEKLPLEEESETEG